MARIHMLRLERVQYREIRISLGVLNGMAPLAERFMYLNDRYLVAVFCRLDHPLKRRLETLRELNLGRCLAGFADVLPLNIFSSGLFTRHDFLALLVTHFVSDHMERALSGVQTSMYSVVAQRELLTVTARYATSMVFYTDGSLIDGCAGFAFHQAGKGGFGYKISSPAAIFTAELTALL
jgi:hypothetical protein